jgi:hypothetical protein
LKWTVWPSEPTAHTSEVPEPQTPQRSAVVPSAPTDCHAPPDQRSTVPPPPAAQTSVDEAPQTPFRSSVVPLGTRAKAVPFQRTIMPALPVPQTSFADAAHAPKRLLVVPLRTSAQILHRPPEQAPWQQSAEVAHASPSELQVQVPSEALQVPEQHSVDELHGWLRTVQHVEDGEQAVPVQQPPAVEHAIPGSPQVAAQVPPTQLPEQQSR